MGNKWLYILLGIVVLLIWEYYGQNNSSVRLLLSSPSYVYKYFQQNYSILLSATYTTFVEALLGLFIATIFSLAVMIFCFYVPRFMNFILPLMVVSQVIPIIVLAPFFIILFGFGISSKVAMAALMCFFPIFINFAQGYKSISQNMHDLMHIYNANTWQRITNVYFPMSYSSIMAGLKISATLAVIGAIVAEFAGAEVGLGKNLFISAIRLEPDLMMSSLILSSLLGIAMYGMVFILEKKIIKQ